MKYQISLVNIYYLLYACQRDYATPTGSQPEAILPPTGHLTMSGHIFH